jgi:hypothetical protein
MSTWNKKNGWLRKERYALGIVKYEKLIAKWSFEISNFNENYCYSKKERWNGKITW